MKKFKIFMCFAVLASVSLMVGCTKDGFKRNSIPIAFENFNGGEKAYIGQSPVDNNYYAFWEDGDQVRLTRRTSENGLIQNYNGVVSIEYENHAAKGSASATEFEPSAGEIVYAGYPKDCFASNSLGQSITFQMPDSYDYVLTNSNQKVSAPMVGKVVVPSSGTETLNLYNLCCLLRIKLDRPTNGSFALDRIVIINETPVADRASMAGTATVNLSGATPTLTMADYSGDDRIIVNFPSVASVNETKYFYVPIPPLPDEQILKILIHNQVSGKWSYNTITTTAAVPSNSIVTIQGPSTTENGTPKYLFKDYITNLTGSSKIDLGVTPSNNMKMEIVFSVPSGYMAGSQYYTGSRPGDVNTQIYFGLSASGSDSKFRAHFCSYPNNQATANFVMSDMDRVAGVKYGQTIEVQKHPSTSGDSANCYRAKVVFQRYNSDGTITNETKYTGYKNGGIPGGATSICVFSLGEVYQSKMNLYSYRIWDGETLLHNFVPAIKQLDDSGNPITPIHGVYDMVDGTFIDPADTPGCTGSFQCN